MKIVVAGGNGYLGRALKRRVESEKDVEGAFLTIDDDPAFPHSDFSREDLASHFAGADAVVHLAAVRGGTRISQFDDNARITENVLLAMADARVKRFVFMSSIAVYSDIALLPWREDQPCTPVSLYGISKLACESLCKLHARRNGLAGTILRLAPVYGEADPNKRMIANFIRQAARGEELSLIGKSVAKRDFVYLEDAVSAILFALRRENDGVDTFNIGGTCPLSNFEIATKVLDAFGHSSSLRYDDSVPENMPPAYMDLSRARSAGFSPAFGMEEALARIAAAEKGSVFRV